MSDDEVDHELLELLRQSLLGSTQKPDDITSDTKVLRHAEFIYDNSIDVNIDARSTRAAAQLIWLQMQQRNYSTETWSEHELHPKSKDEATLNFIFVMDLLNFSFWSEKSEDERFAVEYRGKKWTGYWSLVACLQRALDEGKFLICFPFIAFLPNVHFNHPIQATNMHRIFFVSLTPSQIFQSQHPPSMPMS